MEVASIEILPMDAQDLITLERLNPHLLEHPLAEGLRLEMESVGSPRFSPHHARHLWIRLERLYHEELEALVEGLGRDRIAFYTCPETSDIIALGESRIDRWKIFSESPLCPPELRFALNHLLESSATTSFELSLAGGGTFLLDQNPRVAGILNITPDSFSDGGQFIPSQKAIDHGLEMVELGADLIDIGGESSRPGSDPVPVKTQLSRVLPVIEALSNQVDVPLSIDTTSSLVAKESLAAGAHIVNDISGLHHDPQLATVVASTGASVVLMHMRGTPATMQQDTHYDNLIGEILTSLRTSIRMALTAGVPAHSIIIDPGIGFGKNMDQNFQILSRLSEFRSLGKPILVGPSRKQFIGSSLQRETPDRIHGTAAAVALSVASGAHIVRVHDVSAMKDVARIAAWIRQGQGPVVGVPS